MADVLKLSDEDVEWLYPDLGLEGVLGGAIEGPALVVITRGGDGAAVAMPGRMEPVHVAAAPTTVADTVGAGDSFMAGLISGLLDVGLCGGAAARERLRHGQIDEAKAHVLQAVSRAAANAGVTVARDGAYAPTRDEISVTTR